MGRAISLPAEATRAEAAELVRSLVDQITLVPEDGVLSIVLRGDLAALLSFAADKQKPSGLSATGLGFPSQGSSVAGTRNTRFLRWSSERFRGWKREAL
jgi:site-specific DNA recombinase